MKEATGELNATVVTVIAVAAFAAFFFSYLWPLISDTIDLNQKCGAAICDECADGFCTCYMSDDYDKNSPDESKSFQCVYKG